MLLTLGIIAFTFIVFCCLLAVLSRINDGDEPAAERRIASRISEDHGPGKFAATISHLPNSSIPN